MLYVILKYSVFYKPFLIIFIMHYLFLISFMKKCFCFMLVQIRILFIKTEIKNIYYNNYDR